MIDSYEFGVIVINGQQYTSDVIIYPDEVRNNWWRQHGHWLGLEDINTVTTGDPGLIIVGSGASAKMTVPPIVSQALRANGIDVIVEPTGQACKTYNQLSSTQKVVAVLHLMC
jgi:hypothetical protein